MKTTKNYFLLLVLTLGIGIFSASCSSSDDNKGGNDDDNPPPGKKELTITATNTTIKVDDVVTFSAKFGNEIIKDVQFFIDEQAIESDTKTFDQIGEFKVHAKKATGEKSNTLTISVFKDDEEINNALKFVHKVVVEDFTGAWCGYCPRVADKIEKLEENYPNNIVAIAIHNSKNPNVNHGGHDPFDFFKTERRSFENEVGVGGYPFGMINRVDDFEGNFNKFQTYVKDHSTIGIKINSEIYENDGIVKVGIKFGEDYTEGVKFAVFMVEDHLLFRQSNYLPNLYTNYQTVNGFLQNFEHNNTLVGLANGFRGEEISSAVSVKSGEYTNENIYIKHHAANLDNTRIVVVVTDKNGKVLNAAYTKSNTEMNYQVVR